MKVRNKTIVSNDQEYLVTIRKEYIELGFETSLEQGVLTVFSRKKTKKKGNRNG